MQSGRTKLKRLLCILLTMLTTQALAQLPYVPPELHREQRWLQEDRIRFCIWERSPTAALDRSVAEELASALLLEAVLRTFSVTINLDQDELWEAVFIQLAEQCDAIMGFALVPEGYPDWLITSRAYYRAPYVLAVRNEQYQRLADVPRDRTIGSQLFSEADYLFLGYLQSLPTNNRWRRFPHTSPERLVEQLQAEDIDGVIIWAPLLVELSQGDPTSAGLRMVPLAPLAEVDRLIGIVLRDHNTFLRSLLDEAIVAITEDGTIDQLLQLHNLPGRAETTGAR